MHSVEQGATKNESKVPIFLICLKKCLRNSSLSKKLKSNEEFLNEDPACIVLHEPLLKVPKKFLSSPFFKNEIKHTHFEFKLRTNYVHDICSIYIVKH